jgi:tetratricopeptide (TPR) repeat protein
MRCSFSLIFIVFNFVSYGCLNEEHVNKSGKTTIDFAFGDAIFYKSHNVSEIESTLKILQNAVPIDEEDKLNIKNNIAVQYIKLKKYSDAENILSELLKKNKDNYSVVVNLGTLYELQGRNKLAYEFIKKATLINPDSHDGSEWFHLRILEYKLKNTKVTEKITQNILHLKAYKEDVIIIAGNVDYQLKERIPFTPSPDIMMAKILQEYGDYLADSISIKAAYLIFDLGKEYDSNNYYNFQNKIDSLIPYFKKYNESVPILNNRNYSASKPPFIA